MASLVAGIVIGSKNMPESFWNKLKSTGTAHIVVASGTNVTMTISFLIGLLIVFLKRRTAIWITLLGILGYVIISGFDAPIIRAGIMGSILLFSQETGRIASTWRILIYSAVIMLLIKPTWIINYPREVSPLAKASASADGWAERFEGYIGGKEICDGWSELTDPQVQRQRFTKDSKVARKDKEEAQQVDEEFIEAMEYGMPPIGGIGIGIDRLAMVLLETANIREVIWFPTMRPENK